MPRSPIRESRQECCSQCTDSLSPRHARPLGAPWGMLLFGTVARTVGLLPLAWRPRMRAATRLFGGGAVMLVWWAAVAGAQAAQSRATTEVGTGVGVTILSRSGFNSITHIGAPGGAGPVAPLLPAPVRQLLRDAIGHGRAAALVLLDVE